MTFDTTPGVQHQNRERFAFGIEVRVGDDICPPIICRHIRRFTELERFGCWTFPERDQLPFLGLVVVPQRSCALPGDGLNRLQHRGGDGLVRGRGDDFVGAHVFVFREGAGVLSSPRTERARPLRRNTPERPGGAWTHHCRRERSRSSGVTADAGAPVRGATRGARPRRHEHPKSRPNAGRLGQKVAGSGSACVCYGTALRMRARFRHVQTCGHRYRCQ